MQIEVFNQHPPGVRYTHESLSGNVGKELELKRYGEVIGKAKVLKVEVDGDGITFTLDIFDHIDQHLEFFIDGWVTDISIEEEPQID